MLAQRSVLSATRYLAYRAPTCAGRLLRQPSSSGRRYDSSRFLCTEVSIGDRIVQWRTADQAVADAANNGHLYTDVDMVMAVQQVLSIESARAAEGVPGKKSSPVVQSEWQMSQNVYDLVCVLTSRMQRRPSPAAMALMADGFLHFGLDCRRLLCVCCGTDGPNLGGYLFECAEKFSERKLENLALWSTLLRLIIELPFLSSYSSQIASVLGSCPAFRHEPEKGIVERLKEVFSSKSLEEHSVTDMVNVIRSSYLLSGVDSELIAAVVERGGELTESDMATLCKLLSVSRNVDLAMAIKHRVTHGERIEDLPLYVQVCQVMATHLQMNREFILTASGYLAQRKDELTHPDTMVLLRSFSSVSANVVPEVKGFVHGVLLDHLSSRLSSFTLPDVVSLFEYNQVASKVGSVTVHIMEHFATRVGDFTHEDGSAGDFSKLLSSFTAWEKGRLQFLCRSRGLPYRAGQTMFPRFGHKLCASLAQHDWPLTHYAVFLRCFPALDPDVLTWAKLFHRIHVHLHRMPPAMLIDLHSCMLQYHFSDGDVTCDSVMEEVLNRVADHSFPTSHYPLAVRCIVRSSRGEVLRSRLKAIELSVSERQSSLRPRIWTELIEAWVSEGAAPAKDVFLTACGICRIEQDWSSVDVVRMLTATSKGGIGNRPLLLDLQETEWGQQTVRGIPDHMLPVFLHAYATVAVNAPKLFSLVSERLELYFLRPGTTSRSKQTSDPVANLSELIDVAWSFAVLGHNSPKILAHVLYSGGQDYKSLNVADLLKLNDLHCYGVHERRDLKLSALKGKCLQACRKVAFQRALRLARASHKTTFMNGLDSALVDLLGGEEFIQRNILTEDGFFANYVIQFDELDRPVPFVEVMPIGSPDAPVAESTGLPAYSLSHQSFSFAEYMDDAQAGEKLVSEVAFVDETAVAVAEDASESDGVTELQHDEPVRRLALRYLPENACVTGTDRPAARTLMDLLQMSAVGWTVAGVAEKDWRLLIDPSDRKEYLREKIFPPEYKEKAASH